MGKLNVGMSAQILALHSAFFYYLAWYVVTAITATKFTARISGWQTVVRECQFHCFEQSVLFLMHGDLFVPAVCFLNCHW